MTGPRGRGLQSLAHSDHVTSNQVGLDLRPTWILAAAAVATVGPGWWRPGAVKSCSARSRRLSRALKLCHDAPRLKTLRHAYWRFAILTVIVVRTRKPQRCSQTAESSKQSRRGTRLSLRPARAQMTLGHHQNGLKLWGDAEGSSQNRWSADKAKKLRVKLQ